MPPPASLPAPLVARARAAKRILEVGAGSRFDTALALRQAAPGAEVIVSDVDERVLLAPPGLRALTLDLARPHTAELPDADLVVAVRLPEELQLPAARLAEALGADLAVRALKDEWADVGAARRRVETWPDGWRFYPR